MAVFCINIYYYLWSLFKQNIQFRGVVRRGSDPPKIWDPKEKKLEIEHPDLDLPIGQEPIILIPLSEIPNVAPGR